MDAFWNARLQAGLANPMDRAIVAYDVAREIDVPRKLTAIPFDFARKRLSVLVEEEDHHAPVASDRFWPRWAGR